MIDKYYRRNVFGISSVEFLWGLGLPVVLESTFLQLFLKSLGASSFQIGLIPAFSFLGHSIFALLSSYFTEGLAFKRSAVIYLHIISGMSLILFGVGLLFFGDQSPGLFVFFICYGVFSICIGMTIPVWLSYVVNMFSEKKSYSGLGYMMLAQNIAKLSSSLFIVKFVEKYSFSLSASGGIFISVGLIFSLSAIFFLATKETSLANPESARANRSFWVYVKTTCGHISKNRNFLLFLVGDMDFFVVVTVISFYANYATAFCSIPAPIAAGFFVSFIYIGAIVTNIFLGSLDIFTPRNKYVFSKLAALSAMLLLVSCGYLWGFFLASFLLGVARGSRMIVFPPLVKKLSGLSDATSYFAVAPILTTPFALALPMAYGTFLDLFSNLNGDAYRAVFMMSLFLIAGSLLAILKVKFQFQFSGPTR